MNLLTGKAARWGTAVWEGKDPCCSTFAALSAEMKKVFDRDAAGREAARRLSVLRQGEGSVSDYLIEFRTLAAESGWNKAAQWDRFLHGLADRVQEKIYALDLPSDLDGLITLALRVDSRLRVRPEKRGLPAFCGTSGSDTVSHTNDPEPMQVGRARLSREERERRRAGGLCLYCGGAGHFLNRCPVKRSSPAVERGLLSGGAVLGKPSSATLLSGRLQWATGECAVEALIDSGAEGNFLDRGLVSELEIPTIPLHQPIAVHALNGQTLPTITHSTTPMTLTISGNHIEITTFYITDSLHTPVVLGHPWLIQHQPRVDWGHNTVLGWSNQCHASCL
ncbi:MAG: retropepsin-like aspartic protease family protein, partial [Plesiomonas sp.]